MLKFAKILTLEALGDPKQFITRKIFQKIS